MKNNNHTKIYKKGLALFTSIALGVTGYALVEKNNNTFNKGDSVKATKNVNLRLGTSTDTFKLGTLPKGEIVDRIASINGFDLIRYNNQLAFVSEKFTSSDVLDKNNEYYEIVEDNDIIRTTADVYFRLGPSKSEKKICLLKQNDELVVYGESISYQNPEDIWYIAKYKDKIGFVKKDYTKSLKEILQQTDPSITNVEIKNIGYLNNDSLVFDYQDNIIDKIETYQLVKIIEEKNNYYLVEYENKIGLINKEDINTYDGKFVVVDLSSQSICLYCDTDMVFESACTTGSDLTPTRVGAFSVYERKDSRYFSKSAQSKYLWANFDHGNGIHDAPWENPKKFGDNKYRKEYGSKGCVRLPDEAAIFLKKYIKKGTKVLVKK